MKTIPNYFDPQYVLNVGKIGWYEVIRKDPLAWATYLRDYMSRNPEVLYFEPWCEFCGTEKSAAGTWGGTMFRFMTKASTPQDYLFFATALIAEAEGMIPKPYSPPASMPYQGDDDIPF